MLVTIIFSFSHDDFLKYHFSGLLKLEVGIIVILGNTIHIRVVSLIQHYEVFTKKYPSLFLCILYAKNCILRQKLDFLLSYKLRTINPMNKLEVLDGMSCSTGNDCNDCLILNGYISLTDATISSR